MLPRSSRSVLRCGALCLIKLGLDLQPETSQVGQPTFDIAIQLQMRFTPQTVLALLGVYAGVSNGVEFYCPYIPPKVAISFLTSS